MRDYDYFNARIRGRSTVQLPRSFFEEVLAVPGVPEVVDTLLNSVYAPALRDSMAAGSDLPHVETGLRRYLAERLDQVRDLAPAAAAELLALPFRWTDLRNVIALLRGKVCAMDRDRIATALCPGGLLDEAHLERLLDEPDALTLADTLVTWGLPGAGHARRLLRPRPEPEILPALETALLTDYVAWAETQCAGDDENRVLMRRHLRRQVDVVNVILALRRIQGGPHATEPFRPLGRGLIGPSVLERIAAGPDADSALETLAGTYFAEGVERGIFAFGEHRRLGDIERFLERVVLAAGCRLFRADPLGIGVAAGYIWRQVNEFLNLRILLRGKAYGRPAAAIQEDLLLV